MSTLLLLRIPGVALSQRQCAELLSDVIDTRRTALYLCHGAGAPETYVYLGASLQRAATDGAGTSSGAQEPALNGSLESLRQRLARLSTEATIAELEALQDLRGAAAGSEPAWHYVVETDVAPEAEADFNNWYTQEHMPGLAAVPGTIRAMRLRSLEGSPRYHALYQLQSRETFGSAPWLAVRATDWSSRVRPNFRNTKRTMFHIVT